MDNKRKVYLVTNVMNGKQYVGQTYQELGYYLCTQNSRAKHYPTSKPKFYAAIRKHGIDAFRIEELASCDTVEESNFLEILFIAALETQRGGYNLADGGDVRIGCIPWNKGKRGTQVPWNKGKVCKRGYTRHITWGDKIRQTMLQRGIQPSLMAKRMGGKARHASAGEV